MQKVKKDKGATMRKFMKRILGITMIFISLVIFVMAGTASADPVTGYSTGYFEYLSGTVEYHTLVNDDTLLKWGTLADNPLNLSTLQAGDSNSTFGQTDIYSNGVLTDVKLAALLWDSNDDSKNGFSVNWALSLTLSEPSGSYTFEDNSLAVALNKAQGLDKIVLDNISTVTFSIGNYTVSNLHYVVSGGGALGTDGLTWTTQKDDDVSTLSLVADFTAVPEPGTLLLLGFGLVGLAVLRRKSRK